MKNATYSPFVSLLFSVSLLTSFSPSFVLAEEPKSQDLNSGELTENQILEGRKSYISFFIHDEIAIDFAHEDRDLLPRIKNIFEQGGFKSNMSVGRDYFNLREL